MAMDFGFIGLLLAGRTINVISLAGLAFAVGMTLVILTGGIDLSVGSILALSGAITAGLLKFGIELEALNLYIGFFCDLNCV